MIHSNIPSHRDDFLKLAIEKYQQLQDRGANDHDRPLPDRLQSLARWIGRLSGGTQH